MKKNILKKSIYIITFLSMIAMIVIVLTKAKGMYLALVNSVDNINNKLEVISKDISNNININKSYNEILNKEILNKEVNDSLSDKTIKINLNNEIINLNLKYDNKFYEVDSLIANKDIPIDISLFNISL